MAQKRKIPPAEISVTLSELDLNAAAVSSQAKESLDLLDLPAELVLKILRLAVVCSSIEDPISITSTIGSGENASHRSQDRKRLAQPAIARTCSMLRYEGLKLFYSENFFLASISRKPAHDDFRLWTKAVDPVHLAFVDKLFVEVASPSAPKYVAGSRALFIVRAVTSRTLGVLNAKNSYVRLQSEKVAIYGGEAVRGCCRIAFAKKDDVKDRMHWISLSQVRTGLLFARDEKYWVEFDETC